MKNNIISRLCGTAAVLALATSAIATPTVYVSDGTNARVVEDGGVGDGLAAAGDVLLSGSLGAWTLTVATGTVIGPTGHPNLDLNFTDTFAAGATTGNTITIAFLSDGYTTGPFGAFATIGGTLGSGVTLTYSTYAKSGSTAATTLGTPGTPNTSLNLAGWTGLTSQTFTTTPYNGSATGGVLPPAGGNPYELLQVITITAPTGGTVGNNSSGDATLTVPDGGSTLMLLGSSLTALAFLRRSYKSKA